MLSGEPDSVAYSGLILIFTYLTHLFRYRVHQISLLPREQIRETGDLYESTGSDPQFDVTSDRDCLPRRWVFVSYNLEDPQNFLSPCLFYNKGEGYLRTNVVDLPQQAVQQSSLIRLPYNLMALRLGPTSVKGTFGLSNIRFLEVGYFPLLLILCWRELASAVGKPRILLDKVFSGLACLVVSGPVAARDALAYRHQLKRQNRCLPDYEIEPPPVAPGEARWQVLTD